MHHDGDLRASTTDKPQRGRDKKIHVTKFPCRMT